MSLILRYTSGSTYTLVAELVGQEYGQELAYAYHIPLSDVSAAAGNGLSLSKITIKGMVETKTAVDWQHINGISLDSGTSYQTVVFSSVDWQDDRWSSIYPFALTLIAHVQRVGASVRIPLADASPPYKWGAQSLTLAAHGGNANASPKITLLPPLLHFPLSQSLASYEGTGITFTRAAAKTHGGISYGLNVPAFDNGLVLASDTATDVGKVTLPTATVRSVAMQIKQTRFPSAWVIGTGSPTNLVTNGEFETNTTGWISGGTISRDAATPLVGTGSLKFVSAATSSNCYFQGSGFVIGHTYYITALVKSTATAGRKVHFRTNGAIGSAQYADFDCSAIATQISATFVTAGTTGGLIIELSGAYVVGDSFLVDSVVCFDITALNGVNLLTANQSNAETNTTGMTQAGGTLTRDTGTPLVGTGDFKLVSTGSNDLILKTTTTAVAVTAGQWYAAQALVKCTVAAGRQIKIGISWYTAADALVSTDYGAAVACPSAATVISATLLCPATATKAYIWIDVVSSLINEVLYADSLMLESIPTTLTVWTAALNKLTIYTATNLLKWTDDTTTVQAIFPTSDYMAGTLIDVVVIDDTAHAVTVCAHAAAGAWTTQAGTLAAIAWPELTLGPLEGSVANLTEFDYALTSAEYQALVYSLAPWQFNTLRIPLRYAGTTVKDGQTLTIAGSDHSGLLGGSDVAVGASNVTLTETGGIACRWYAELARTDTP